MAEATPWGEMLRTAIGMGLAPEEFWRLSLREWRMLTAGPVGVVPLRRGEFEAMMQAWPDEISPSPEGEGG